MSSIWFIGEEYKQARKAILANMSGGGSHKKPKEAAPADDGIGTTPQGDCLSCGQSLSEPGEAGSDHDRLFCAERQEYVSEDGVCPAYN